MRYYPIGNPRIYQECCNLWDLYCQKQYLTWHRKPQEAKHSINTHRDIEGAKLEFVFKKDYCIKGWKLPRRRRLACLPIYYGSGIERPKDNYDYDKLNALLEILKKLKGEPKKRRRTPIFRKKGKAPQGKR